MTLTIGALLALSFLISVLGLFMFIWAQTRGLMRAGPEAAQVIFEPGELGMVEEPAISSIQRGGLQRIESNANDAIPNGDAQRAAHMRLDLLIREGQDRSSRAAAFAFLTSSILWLVLGSLAGLIASQKLTSPDFLTQSAWLTFGRIRTAHLNMVIYGWASMAGLGIALWMLPRLLKTRLVGERYAVAGAALSRLTVDTTVASSKWSPTALNRSTISRPMRAITAIKCSISSRTARRYII